MSKIITIQPGPYVDNLYSDDRGGTFEGYKLPYPFHVSEDGSIGRQDVWDGNPLRVIGFVKDLARQEVDVWWFDAVKDPQSIVGMYVITQDKAGEMATHTTAIQSVEEIER